MHDFIARVTLSSTLTNMYDFITRVTLPYNLKSLKSIEIIIFKNIIISKFIKL
jgi:hypothetical protein